MPYLFPGSLCLIYPLAKEFLLPHSFHSIIVYNSSVICLFSFLVDYKLSEGEDRFLFTFAYLLADRFLELNIQYPSESQIWDPDKLGLGSG